jgi:hypothetical protein
MQQAQGNRIPDAVTTGPNQVAGAERDRSTSAPIAAITRRHLRGRSLTGVEEAAALAELAGGRGSLCLSAAG